MNLELRREPIGKYRVVHVQGVITGLDGMALDRCLKGLYADGVRHIALDLKDVAMLDSSAISVVLFTYKKMQPDNGSLVFVDAGKAVVDAFSILNLDQLFTRYDSLEALAAANS